MNADDFKRLAKNPDFIPGIYNYCDRWCERCRFTHRCMNYATQDEMGVAEKKVGTRKALKIVKNSLEVAMQLMVELMRKHGIDPDAVAQEAKTDKKPLAFRSRTERLKIPYLRSSMKYAQVVREWFKQRARDFKLRGVDLHQSLMLGAVSEEDAENEIAQLRDAVDVILWYQYLIHVKLSRAAGQLEDLAEDDDPEWAESAHDDADGSAKVALIGIDNSLRAWDVLRKHFPRRQREIDRTRTGLAKLRTAVEKAYPNARTFQRPGFDIMPRKRKR